MAPDPFPLSRELLEAVLADRTSDRFVCERIWERLGYVPGDDPAAPWRAGPTTPDPWRQAFPDLHDVTFHIDPEDDQGMLAHSHQPGLPLRSEVEAQLAEALRTEPRRATSSKHRKAWEIAGMGRV